MQGRLEILLTWVIGPCGTIFSRQQPPTSKGVWFDSKKHAENHKIEPGSHSGERWDSIHVPERFWIQDQIRDEAVEYFLEFIQY